MPPGNRSKRKNRGRACDGHSNGPSTNNTAKHSSDKPTPTTADNVSASKPANKSLNTLNASVHTTNEEDVAAAVCWICAEPVKYYSLSACNHRTCHVCALRLRVLYEKLECTFCKEPQPTVIFTTSPDADFLSYTPDAIPYKDTKLSIFFETEDMMEETLILLRFNCPGLDCDHIASGWGDLKLHTRTMHGKVLCDLCIQFKKVFAHEHALYAPNVLPLHLPSIPHRPRKQPLNEIIECGIHPLCEFCNECFFGEDELFVHMRERHEECFLCKRNEVRDQYFLNYNSLELHFSQTHFACTDPVCQAEKFVVFDSELDLNAHRLEVHGANMSPKAKREARRLQVGFEFDGTGNGSRRGELNGADRQGDHEAMPRTVQTQGSVPGRPRVAIEEYSMTESTRMRRRRASSGLAASVKTAIPGNRAKQSSAHDLISTVWDVLDQNLHDTTSIINAIADFLEEGEKKDDLLSTWNEFGIDSEQPHDLFPTLTGSPVYAAITTECLEMVHATAPRCSEQSPRLDHHVAHPASLSSSPSRTVPGPSVPPFASSGGAQLEAFPSFIRPPTNINPTPGSHQSQKPKSWASIVALSASAWSSAIIPKGTDGAHQPPQYQQPPSSAGPSADTYTYPYPHRYADVAPAFYGNRPPHPPHTWASLAGNDISAWTPNWNRRGGEEISARMGTGPEPPMFARASEWSEVTVGQGKKGKGKQRQRPV